jgi:hypothetical protein
MSQDSSAHQLASHRTQPSWPPPKCAGRVRRSRRGQALGRRPCFTLATTKGRQRSRRPPLPRRFVQSGSSTFRYGSPRLSSNQPGRDLERRGAVRTWLCNLGHCMRTPSERCIRLDITCIRLWSVYLADHYRTALARSCVRSRRKCPRVAWHLLRGRTSSADGRIEAKPCG